MGSPFTNSLYRLETTTNSDYHEAAEKTSPIRTCSVLTRATMGRCRERLKAVIHKEMIGTPSVSVKAGITGKSWRRCADGKGLKGELELFPVAAPDSGPHIIAGAGGNNQRCRLFAGSATGEAEFIVG
jgi:hypothetical protein